MGTLLQSMEWFKSGNLNYCSTSTNDVKTVEMVPEMHNILSDEH